MNLILLGIPGSGKGSVAELLTSELDQPHIAPGDILREELRRKSRLGLLARPFMEKGELVPDEIVLEVMEKRLRKPDSKGGFILDGFPRTLIQAEMLDQILAGLNKKIDLVLKFEISDQTAVRRLAGRRTCSVCGAIYNLHGKPPRKEDVCDICGGKLFQRPDDKEEVIYHRLGVYRRTTQPIEEYYGRQRKLASVNAESNPRTVLSQVLHAIQAL